MYSMDKTTFNFLSKDEILVGAWVSPPPSDTCGKHGSFINSKQYLNIKESGINTIYGLYERGDIEIEDVHQALIQAERNGINYLVRDERLRQVDSVDDYNRILNQYIQYDSFAGFLFWDEPGIIDFKKIRKIFDISKDSIAKEKLIYVNLLPIYADSNQFLSGASAPLKTQGLITPEEYYQNYVEITDPEYISYDFYPFEDDFPGLKEGFFNQYSLVNRIASAKQLPVLCFIQLVTYAKHVRLPIKSEILFHINISLAYNIKGIQYFTYFLPVNDASERFKGAMINHQGEKTEIYDHVKSANAFIQLIQSEIKHAKWLGIYEIGSAVIPEVDKVALEGVQVEGDHIIIGVFTHLNSILHYVVNSSLTESSECLMKFGKRTQTTIYDQNNLSCENKDIDDKFTFSLLPGEARLIKIHNC